MKDPFSKLIHHYTYDIRFKTKLVIFHIILVLLPTAVPSGLLYLRIYGIVMDDSIRSEQALSVQAMTLIENLISHVGHASGTITSVMLIQDLSQVPRAEADTTDISTSRMNSLFHLVQSIMDHSMITDVEIYHDSSVYGDLMQYNKIGNILFNPVPSVSSSYWYGTYSIPNQARLLCSEPYLTPDETEKNGKLAYITRIPYTHDGGAVSGTESTSAHVALYSSRPASDMVLRNDATVTDEVAFLVDERDVIVSASDMDLAGKYFTPRPDPGQRVGKEKMSFFISYLDGSAYVAYFPIVDTDWCMVSIILALHTGDAGRALMTHFALIRLLFTALALYTAFYLPGSIADRIIGVALQMETVRTGPPQPMNVANTGCDEIDALSDIYNYMTEEAIILTDSQKKASDELRMAGFHALQAQTNPYFLHNTLDMINWLSQTGQSEKVTEAVQILSRLYKPTLNHRELMSSIEKELEHISLCARLQNMYYDNYVASVVDVSEEICEYTIPKLTFQPTVENAFLRGVMMKEEKKGSVLLTGRPDGDDIVFIISDDGVSTPPETLDTLKDDVNVDTDSSASPRRTAFPGHIDVYNINLRLKSLYGESYGLSFTSTLGKGTEVTVRIPARHITSD